MKNKRKTLKARFQMLLEENEPGLAESLAKAIGLKEKNIGGKLAYSKNEVLRYSLHFTAQHFGIEKPNLTPAGCQIQSFTEAHDHGKAEPASPAKAEPSPRSEKRLRSGQTKGS